MDFGSSFYVSQEEFNLFHRTDRELYKILVMSLSREPTESMQVYAMWLWLERVGFRNVVKRVLSLPNILINEVAEETVMCLNCIRSNNLIIASESTEIPLLQSMVDKEISVQFMQENRVNAVEGVAKVVQEVCVRAFTDIMQQAMVRNSNEGQNQGSSHGNGANGPFWFGSIGPANVAADERTLFVTFSKGYRVEEWEVREFFVMAYGDCIEALYMQEVQPNEQALFARIVFRMVSTIDMILGGASKAKFSINGKHVWARKFVPKRTATRTNLLPNFPGESSASGSPSGS
ncbi:uncharacterized protein LOC109809782 [Cajanus cajan]|uniref:Uncharacterized protein n=1 Tax=Cajanus cajan TaxID=3821 RepID=A0A151SSN9_CAJCA|nr:uncharacterized protein LOC109809782 [Cajanus cajan]KYP57837.1 hypothetical protein KK1_004118 [Cajanus cajan]